ncbi:hypothetical protein K503DRAFT_777602 [Rhizopogon vinicolor AM-OR11-026]|uniref:Uncharacterized protein n=1 Tax=Rhizopogon vinicolor AM-OR11-026 TaxID=1314800 RepID=A0A1B7MFN8_9AGAM|nr:hypothetical protein K503DRAFT_777602 [Rhizopogon vinicolor AM-OR11-026]
MRSIDRSDITIKASEEMSSLVDGLTQFATRVDPRVSSTLKELKPLSTADVAHWVDCWEAVVMFQ